LKDDLEFDLSYGLAHLNNNPVEMPCIEQLQEFQLQVLQETVFDDKDKVYPSFELLADTNKTVDARHAQKNSTSNVRLRPGKEQLTALDKLLPRQSERFVYDILVLKDLEAELLRFIGKMLLAEQFKETRAKDKLDRDYFTKMPNSDFDGSLHQLQALLRSFLNLASSYYCLSLTQMQDEDRGFETEQNEDQRQDKLQVKITNSFLRLCVHSMCRYYCLNSISFDRHGERITVISFSFPRGCEYQYPPCTFTEFLCSEVVAD
jgi:hypothetical protein